MKKIKIVQVPPDHVSGKIQYLSEGMSINERLKEQIEPSSAFPEEERIRVKGIAELREYSNKDVLAGNLYNGVNRPITSVVFRVIAQNDKEVVLWDKIFRTMISIKPESSKAFNLPLTDIHDIASLLWMIEEVHG
jgi:hypothetical protein